MSDKYFYILCRDGQIIEVQNKQGTFDAVFGAMLEKGVVVLKEYGSVLNGTDISKVLNENQYDAWVSSTSPKEYIKDGAWRDSKERKVIRYEAWKEKEIEDRKKTMLNETNPQELTQEQYKKLFEKYRPEFMRNTKDSIPPHDAELTNNAKVYRD